MTRMKYFLKLKDLYLQEFTLVIIIYLRCFIFTKVIKKP